MISVVIPTFKNKLFFLTTLKGNLPYLKNCETIIVNDNPEISLRREISDLKGVILVENKTNLGFSHSANIGIDKASRKYVFLLNDDVVLKNSLFEKLISRFKKDQNLFAITLAQIEKDGTVVGKNFMYWEKGFVHHRKKDDLKSGLNAWAEGGSSIIDKAKFKELGGFDPIYSPFYWEDIDLSYRAYQSGYKIYFDPTITVDHHHSTTIKSVYSDSFISQIAFRNQLLFIWKNITDNRLILEHLIHILPTTIKGGPSFCLGFIKALARLPGIIIRKFNHHPKTSIITKERTTLP